MSSVIPGSLCPWLPLQFCDVNGVPVAFGSVKFNVAGSSPAVAKNTYADSGLNVVNANPVALSASGQPVNGSSPIAIFFEPGGYDVQVFDANSAQLYTRLGVEDVGMTFAAQFNSSLMAGARNVDVTSGYSVLGTDNFITVTGTGTITLPASATRTFPIGIKNIGSGTVTINAHSGEFIDTTLTSWTLGPSSSPTYHTVWMGPDVVAGAGFLTIASY